MKTKKYPDCLIFAHRGASRQAPENTKAAFDKALEYTIAGIETDVQLSQDNIPVLWHDRSLKKLGIPDKRIDDFDFDPLNKICRTHSAGESFDLMRLQRFVDLYRGRCILNLEVKNRDWESLQRQQLKILLTLRIIGSSTLDDIFVSSFNLNSLIFAQQLTDQVPFFYILNDHHTSVDIENSLRENPFLTGYCIPIRLVDKTIVQNLRDCDKYIVTYTCNSRTEILKAFDHKVDIMITDDPQKALQLRSQ